MIRVFIGFDAKETVAWHVLSHSILRRSSSPVSLVPLNLSSLKSELWRQRADLQSTDFSFSRFLTPYLSDYAGWSIYLDCDMLMLDDIAKLWALRDDRFAVMCVKHDHSPNERTKFLDQPQSNYEKKNWSSVMLFNNDRCRALTPDVVNSSSGLALHQFKWLQSEELIGTLPQAWNHLVGYHEIGGSVSNLHFTAGGPYFVEYADCDFAAEWFAEREAMLGVVKSQVASDQ